MNLASAYPNSALSAGAMMAIAFVVIGALAFWLVAVYVAAREPRVQREPHARRAQRDAAMTVPGGTTPDQTAEDRHSDTSNGQVAQPAAAA